MIFIKLFLHISLLLFVSFTLSIIDWVPSFFVENIVNFCIISLYILAVFYLYKTIKIHYDEQEHKVLYKSIVLTTLFLIYMGLFALLSIGVGYSKSSYVQSYAFNKKIFYVYKSIDNAYEVSVKDTYLPIRSVSIASFRGPLVYLQKDENYVYATSQDLYAKIYDLNTNTPIINKKDKNE